MVDVDDYALEMRRRGLAPGTIERRVRCITVLARQHDLERVTGKDIQAFLDARGLQPRTRYAWLSHLSLFFEWCVINELVDKNPCVKLRRPKLGRLIPNPTPEHEVERAVAMATTAVMRSWVTLMAFAGLRCAEVAGLRGENFDRGAGTLRVTGKGNKTRVVPVHPRVDAVLRDAPAMGWVYVEAATGLPYSPPQVSKLVGRHLRACGLTHTRAHLLRHRFASALLDSGADIAVVAELLGHESLETTRGYAAVKLRQMRAAIELL